MNFLKKLSAIIKKLEEVIIAFAIIIISLILIYNVFARSVLGFSWKAAEEVSSFFIIALTFMTVSYAARSGKHITMTVALDLLPKTGKKILLTVASLLAVVSLLWMAKLSFEYVVYVESMGRVAPATEIPAWLPLIPMPVGFALGAIQYAITFILNLVHRDRTYVGSEATYGEAGAEVTL